LKTNRTEFVRDFFEFVVVVVDSCILCLRINIVVN